MKSTLRCALVGAAGLLLAPLSGVAVSTPESYRLEVRTTRGLRVGVLAEADADAHRQSDQARVRRVLVAEVESVLRRLYGAEVKVTLAASVAGVAAVAPDQCDAIVVMGDRVPRGLTTDGRQILRGKSVSSDPKRSFNVFVSTRDPQLGEMLAQALEEALFSAPVKRALTGAD